jgi:hypothetical protein
MNRGAIRWTIEVQAESEGSSAADAPRAGGDQFRIACIKDEILMVAKFEKVSETA